MTILEKLLLGRIKSYIRAAYEAGRRQGFREGLHARDQLLNDNRGVILGVDIEAEVEKILEREGF